MTHKYPEFQLAFSKKMEDTTAHGGMLLIFKVIGRSGLLQQYMKTVKLRGPNHVWQDVHYWLLFLILNWLGMDAVSDRDRLAQDKALIEAYHRCFRPYLPKCKRRKKILPSVSSCLRYINDHTEESLQALWRCNKTVLHFMQAQNCQETATLDIDATLVPTYKRSAAYCYQQYKAYQPLNLYWAEQQAIVFSEFKAGNINASIDLLGCLDQGRGMLPASVKKINVRSDAAGYQVRFIQGCIDRKIGFTISGMISQSIRDEANTLPASAWCALKNEDDITVGEYASIVNPSDIIPEKTRFFLIRRELSPQCELLDEKGLSPTEVTPKDLPEEQAQVYKELPAKQAIIRDKRYRLSVVVTNRDDLADHELIQFHYRRCGHSEDLHRTLKHDLAAGKMPCAHQQANAFWWATACYSFQSHTLIRLFMGASFKTARIKTIRAYLIDLPARCIRHAKTVVFQFSLHTQERLKSLLRAISMAADDPPVTV